MLEKYEELQVGARYKNYKKVCEVLCVEPLAGSSKIKQVAQWGLNFTWRRERYEWIVLSVHEDPEAMSKGMATAAMLRLGILAYLKREVEVGERVRIVSENETGIETGIVGREDVVTVALCREEMTEIAGLVNQQFFKGSGGSWKRKTGTETEIENQFFSLVRSKCFGFITYSLRSLEKDRTFICNLSYKVIKRGGKAYEIASLYEAGKINEIYTLVLKEMGCESLQNVWGKNIVKPFFLEVRSRVLEQLSIIAHKNVYLITTTKASIEAKLGGVISEKDMLKLTSSTNKQNVTRLRKHYEKVYLDYLAIKDTYSDGMTTAQLMEYPENWVEENHKLIEKNVKLGEVV